jgi:PP-loop superfamily ATP-utilizing enzyme
VRKGHIRSSDERRKDSSLLWVFGVSSSGIEAVLVSVLHNVLQPGEREREREQAKEPEISERLFA